MVVFIFLTTQFDNKKFINSMFLTDYFSDSFKYLGNKILSNPNNLNHFFLQKRIAHPPITLPYKINF